MDIFLVRHAKSAHDSSRWKTDAVRPLADKGIARQQKTSKGMLDKSINFDTVWVSPFRRAQETLDIILDAYDLDLVPKVEDELKVWGDPNEVKSLLDSHYKQYPDDKLLLVGHNPNMSDLVTILTSEEIQMRTSDLVHIGCKDGKYHLQEYYPRSKLMKD